MFGDVDATLMVISDTARSGPLPLEEALVAACSGGARIVQLREKALSSQALYTLALGLKRRLPEQVLFLINDRLDIALAVGADGVHLPEHGLPVSLVRSMFAQYGHRGHTWVGRSVHSLDAARAAAQEGVDYLLVGTMFATSSKPGKVPEGPSLLHSIRAEVTLPVLGVGGITPENAAEVMQAGADGVAVISYILQHQTPADRAKALCQVINKSHTRSTP